MLTPLFGGGFAAHVGGPVISTLGHSMRALVAPIVFLLLPSAYGATELVMHEGITMDVQKDESAIKIRSGKGFDRTYEWDGCALKSRMRARTNRWYGSLGIYDPSASFGHSFFPRGCSGISRAVVQEGQIHFNDLSFAYEWIRRRPRSYKTVWTKDGLLVSWATVPGRAQLSVDVWLICINGKRAVQLNGATDSGIKITANGKGQDIHECAVVGSDIIGQTRKQLEEDWRMVDAWIEKSEKYRQRKQ